MHLLCALGWHRPESTTIRNEGRHFGRCRRCNSDLIEVGRGWKRAPRGYRIVWKKAEPEVPPVAAAAPDPVPGIADHTASASAEIAAEVQAAADVEAEPEVPAPPPLVRRTRADRRTAKAADMPPQPAERERRGKRAARKGLGKPDLPPA